MLEVSAEQKHREIILHHPQTAVQIEKYNISKSVNKTHSKSYSTVQLAKFEETKHAYQQQLPL